VPQSPRNLAPGDIADALDPREVVAVVMVIVGKLPGVMRVKVSYLLLPPVQNSVCFGRIYQRYWV
jgi:hypothetical protein